MTQPLVVDIEDLDYRLRRTARLFGGLMLLACVAPWAFVPEQTVFYWSLLDKAQGGTKFFFVWFGLAGVGASLLAGTEKLSPILRSLGLALLGLIGVISVIQLAGGGGKGELLPSSSSLSTLSLLGLAGAAFGLAYRIQHPRSLGARLLLGLGLVAMILYFFIPIRVLPGTPEKSPLSFLLSSWKHSPNAVRVMLAYGLGPLALAAAALPALLPTRDERASGPQASPYFRALLLAYLWYAPSAILLLMGIAIFQVDQAIKLTPMFLFIAGIIAGYFTFLVRGGTQVVLLLSPGVAAAAPRPDPFAPESVNPLAAAPRHGPPANDPFAFAPPVPSSGGPAVAAPPAAPPPCPACGAPMRYVAERSRHECDACRARG